MTNKSKAQPAHPFWRIVAADVEVEVACIQAANAETAIARLQTIRHLLSLPARHAARYQVLVAEKVKQLEVIRSARFTEDFFRVFHEAMEYAYSS
jgi:hypothetical protein